MSRFLVQKLQSLAPYVPGEQPQDMQYVKLNTNESPFPPSPRVVEALSSAIISRLNLYPDPLCKTLCETIAAEYALQAENVFVGNGSDEVLAFAFMAYGDKRGFAFPQISYGFYPVYANLFGLQARKVPLNEDFSIPAEKFCNLGMPIAIANPNAPTSLAMTRKDIERILQTNPDSVVLIDEAYIDYGGEPCLPLLDQYPNLLIVRTYSKSRSLAGGRLGYALASREIIDDLNRIKHSFNPYSINSLTMLAGIEAMRDREYFESCVTATIAQRELTQNDLRALGFTVLDSASNFLFAAPPNMSGEAYYRGLKQRGVLVRYFNDPKLKAFVRITIGSAAQMQALLDTTKVLFEEAGA
ncbi:MAG TPA: histidinol-phosphate transaminase [Candidatus Limiplasma sp.]|nr:histidinol-phosphate transaminase [Candidatus Limiplasma sp.]HRX09508.1 histidinol-phosphate transaminase [Candidatus Limiplasma sp.]